MWFVLVATLVGDAGDAWGRLEVQEGSEKHTYQFKSEKHVTIADGLECVGEVTNLPMTTWYVPRVTCSYNGIEFNTQGQLCHNGGVALLGVAVPSGNGKSKSSRRQVTLTVRCGLF